MAQCRWHCNYKDFSQLLIRWCFHVPASIIRLTRADFLYVNQLFIGLFPPEQISLLHVNAAALPLPVESRSQGRPPARTPPNLVSIHLGAPGPRFRSAVQHKCTDSCTSSAGVIFFWKLNMLLRDYPTLWAAVWWKIPLSQLQKRDTQACYYLLTQTGLKPETIQEESCGCSREVLN